MNNSPPALGKLFVWFWEVAGARKEHQLVLWDKESCRAELLCFSYFKVSEKWVFNWGPSCLNHANKNNWDFRNYWSYFWESNPL